MATKKHPTKKVTKPDAPKVPHRLPAAWRLARTALQTLRTDKWVYIVITAIYALLTAVLVRFPFHLNDTAAQKLIESGGHVAAFVTLATTNPSGDKAGGTYDIFITLISSLALVYALRQSFNRADSRASAGAQIRDAFYKGMHPLIPAILVLAVILLQILPLIIGAGVYSALATTIRNPIVLVVAALLVIIPLVFVMRALLSSLLALYIIALPDVTPLAGLRSARQLVAGRRFMVLRKMLFLPALLLLVEVVVVLPSLFFAPALAPLLVFIIMTVSLPMIHAYFYTLYRELLND